MNFQSFDEVLRTYLDDKEKAKDEGRDNDWWYASELGMCLRKSFFRRLGLSNSDEKEYRIKFVAEDGNAGHNWRQGAAQEMGVLVEKEGSLVDEKLKYRGRFDLIIQLTQGKSIIDIKTQRSEAFFKRAKKRIGERVEEFQKLQLASYFYFARQKYPDLIDARIYYVDRGGGVREEYIFHFRQEIFDKIVGELELLNKFWENEQLPPKDSRKWVCRYCPYKTICTNVEDNKLNVKQIKELYGSKNENTKGQSEETGQTSHPEGTGTPCNPCGIGRISQPLR